MPFSEDGRWIVRRRRTAGRDGRIVACGDFADVRAAHPEPPTSDLRGGFLLPGFIDTHVHFPQLRIIGGLGARTARMAGAVRAAGRDRAWPTSRTRARRRADSCTRWRLTARRRRWCSARISRPPRRAVRSGRSRGTAHGQRTGALRPLAPPDLHQHAGAAPIARARTLIDGFTAGPAALCGDAAVRAFGHRSDARGLPDAAARTCRAAVPDAPQ